MGDVLEISYRMKGWKLVLAICVIGTIAAVLGYLALNNEDGIRFFGLFTLPPVGATVFLWLIAGLLGAVSVGASAALASGVTRRTLHIRLTPTDFTAPRGLFLRETLTVPLAEIREVAIQNVNGVQILQVKTARGNFGINRADIGKDNFDELAGRLGAIASG